MTWFLFAVLGTAIFGLVALTDKYMLTVHFKDPLVYAWSTGVQGGLLSLLGLALLVPASGVELPGGWRAAGLLLPGAVLFLSTFLYMRALSVGAAPVVMAYSQLAPAFALMLGIWVLSESLSLVQLVGMLVVMGSAIALALDRVPHGSGRLTAPHSSLRPLAADVRPPLDDSTARRSLVAALGAVLPLMLASCAFRATSDLLLKQRTGQAGVAVAYLASRQGILLCALALLLHRPSRRRIVAGLRATTGGTWIRVLAVGLAALLSFYLVATALSRGPLALVSVISSNVAVFTLAYAVVLGRVLKLPNVPPVGVAWQRLAACLALMAIGTAALTAAF